MRILVDCIPYDDGKSGISVYVREVVRALAAQGHDLTLLTEPGVAARHFPGFRAIEAPGYTRHAALSALWHLFVLPRRLARWRADFDGFFVTAANRRVCWRWPLPTVATVHDLANVHIQGKYSPLRMLYLAHLLPCVVRRADRLVAVSRATADDMAAHWRIPASRVTVLYNGVSPLPHPAGRPSWVEANGLRPNGYLLYVSRIEHPGKNHVRLIAAFERLDADLDLVIAGSDWKDADVVHARAAASPRAARIRFTGFLPNEDLAEAYRGAALYVFPSRFEGFGLSLVEAFAEGVPCACSANGALGEIAGDAAETFDPDDVEAMAAALRRVLGESADARAARVTRGRARAAAFSWTAHAEGLARLLDAARADRASVRLFGIPVARLTQDAFAACMVAFAKGPRTRPRLVATLNVDFVANAVAGCGFSGNAELLGYLQRADLVTADGMPIVLLSRLLGRALPARVTGADLVPDLARRLAEEGLSFYVLGGEEPALTEALAVLRAANPGLRVAGTDTSRVSLDDGPATAAIVARINAAQPDVLFVALGNPKQELWAARFAARLRVPVLVGVGGSFNFISGHVKRAPRWMQRMGLEWVWRLAVEPRRLGRRYAYGFVKFGCLSLAALAAALLAGVRGEARPDGANMV